MTASAKKIQTAKARLERRLRDAEWLRAIGVGLVGEEPGIVVSVSADGEQMAKAMVERFVTDVPAVVRVVSSIRKRPGN